MNNDKPLATAKHGGCVQLGHGPWPEIDAILADAYSAGAEGLPFGGIARRAAVRAALSAQPSPGGQGEAHIPLATPGKGEWSKGWNACRDAMLRGEGEALAARQPVGGQGDEGLRKAIADVVAESRTVAHVSAMGNQTGDAQRCLDAAQQRLDAALDSRQPVGEPVSKSVGIDALVQMLVDDAEECAKGWLDRGDAYASGKSAGLLAAADYFRKIATSQRWSEFLSSPAQAVDLAEFNALYRAYVRLLESGRDRIIDLGGTCDPVDVMEANDVDLQAARRVMDSQVVGK